MRHMNDTQALDQLAVMLGESPEWSPAAEYLEAIANLVAATGRPHPGDQDPDMYAAKVAAWHRDRDGEMTNVWNAHTNELGDWCPHSGTRTTAALDSNAACPAGCPDSCVSTDWIADNVLTRLYEAAGGGEVDVLDELAERARLVWVCSTCPWRNPEHATHCEACGTTR